MVSRFVLIALVAVILTLLFALPVGIAGRRLRTEELEDQESVNVSQIYGRNVAWSCSGAAETFSDTDLELVKYTSGRPVLISAQMHATLGSNSGIAIRAVIDGQPRDLMDTRHAVSTFDETTTLTYTHVFEVDRGTHRYGIQCSGSGANASLGLRWLSVHEIR